LIEEIKMKKTFEGWLYNRIEKLGDKLFNHVGCRGKDEGFINFLTQFVPEVGMKRKVTFTVETQGKPKVIKSYRVGKNYQSEYRSKVGKSKKKQKTQRTKKTND
jgi:hypothetical protein